MPATGNRKVFIMTFVKALTIGTVFASSLLASGAFAKSHDQGRAPKPTAETADPAPGVGVGIETVGPAHTLGATLSAARGQAEGHRNPDAGPGLTPAVGNAGRDE
jgi:hypothetical protein